MTDETPRVHSVPIQLDVGESFHITPFSDLHIDDSLCDLKALRAIADQRRDLHNHYAIAIGDIFNLVVPTDLKRYRPSVQPKEISGRDDWANATLSYTVGILKSLNLNWLMVSPGNHEDEFTKRTGVDLTTLLAAELGAFRGGYSGAIDFNVKLWKDKHSSSLFRIVYHHGAWGGRTNKGYSGAWPFFSQIDGWHLALYGHNHAGRVDPEIRRKLFQNRLIEYPVYLVNCLSFVKSYSDNGKETHYAERRGYQPQPRKVPLITVTRMPRNDSARKRGEFVPYLDYKVTV